MKFFTSLTAVVALALALEIFAMGTARSQSVFIDTVEVGDAGNPDDWTGFGGVSDVFYMATKEVTLLQYTSFLNAVAAEDPHGLYNPNMATDLNIAGISRSGVSGSFSYSLIGNGDRPVTYVSWFDAARFANWMANGQPVGTQTSLTTENGAYSLLGATSGSAFAKNAINPNTGAETIWWIPSEDEWYKAAYYDPGAEGPVDGYWLFPTRSDDVPGNWPGPFPNQANHRDWTTGVYSMTGDTNYSPLANYLAEGGTYSNSASYYGTYDQGGNVAEWSDLATPTTDQAVRGGSWFDWDDPMESSFAGIRVATAEDSVLGFRLASSVPEPSAALLILMGGAVCWLRSRCRRA